MILNRYFLFVFVAIFLTGCFMTAEQRYNSIWENASEVAKAKKEFYEDLANKSKDFYIKPSNGMANLYIFGSGSKCNMTLVPNGDELFKNIQYIGTSARSQKVYLDNEFIGNQQTWQYYLLHLKPGIHKLKFDDKEVEVDLKSNDNTYVIALNHLWSTIAIKNQDEFIKIKSSLFRSYQYYFDFTENNDLNEATINYLMKERE